MLGVTPGCVELPFRPSRLQGARTMTNPTAVVACMESRKQMETKSTLEVYRMRLNYFTKRGEDCN